MLTTMGFEDINHGTTMTLGPEKVPESTSAAAGLAAALENMPDYGESLTSKLQTLNSAHVEELDQAFNSDGLDLQALTWIENDEQAATVASLLDAWLAAKPVDTATTMRALTEYLENI